MLIGQVRISPVGPNSDDVGRSRRPNYQGKTQQTRMKKEGQTNIHRGLRQTDGRQRNFALSKKDESQRTGYNQAKNTATIIAGVKEADSHKDQQGYAVSPHGEKKNLTPRHVL